MFTGVVNLLTFKWLCSRVVRGEGRRRDLGRQSRNLESWGECYGLLLLVTAHAIARRANVHAGCYACYGCYASKSPLREGRKAARLPVLRSGLLRRVESLKAKG